MVNKWKMQLNLLSKPKPKRCSFILSRYRTTQRSEEENIKTERERVKRDLETETSCSLRTEARTPTNNIKTTAKQRQMPRCVTAIALFSLIFSLFPTSQTQPRKKRKEERKSSREREREKKCVCVFCRVSLVRAPTKRPSYRLSILKNKKIRKNYNSFNAVSNGSGYPLCFDLTVVRFLTLN